MTKPITGRIAILRSSWVRYLLVGLIAIALLNVMLEAEQQIGPDTYYDRLAEAFLHGQTQLLIRPPAELLALPDPYDPVANKPYRLHDAVLYKGNYYLYWGPAPALILVALKPFVGMRTIPDHFLVYGFVCGLLYVVKQLLVDLHRLIFPEMPEWSLLPGLLLIIGGTPLLYILRRPVIYEAAIMGGQFGLITALWLMLRAIQTGHRRWIMATLAGCFAALAISSRLSLIPVIGLMGLMLIVWLWYVAGRNLNQIKWPILIGFVAPLVACAIGLALYNLVRFDSPIEFGQRYQLSNTNVFADASRLVSPDYIVPNLYIYLFSSPTLITEFPFVLARWNAPLLPSFISTPTSYLSNEPIVGILPAIPFALLALPALAVRYTQNARHSPDNQHAMRIWLVAGIAGMVFIAFTTLLFFIGITMRYLLDFLPLTMILANIGLWSALELTKDRPHARTALYIVTGVLFVYSIIIGLLLGTTGYLYPPSF